MSFLEPADASFAQDGSMGSDVHVSLLSPSEPTWPAVARGVGNDVYHLPKLVAIAARHEGKEPVAVFANLEGGRLLNPLIVCPVPEEFAKNGKFLFDAMSPQRYSFPLAVIPDPSRGEVVEGLLI